MKMTFHNQGADFFIPDGVYEDEALARITHLGIGAHQDDLEFMAFHGISSCYSDKEKWFGGVTCTNGTGSIGKDNDAAEMTMRARRQEEQRAAATMGRYAAMIQLDYPSEEVRSPKSIFLKDDLEGIFLATQPDIVYTHNLADKHSTHIGVVITVIKTLRHMSPENRPTKLLGCEMWRGLDWMPDRDKVALDVSGHDHLAAALHNIFDSQITDGKRYDRAIPGRRSANATLFDPYSSDQAKQLCFAMDLTPLIREETLDIADYTCSFIEKFHKDVRSQINQMK